MKILPTAGRMRAACSAAKQGHKRLGLVPTMGALHEGHLSLVRASRTQCDVTAVSIFVNPTQFGPGEDFSRYPRDLERDRKLLEAEGVSLLFAPSVEEMYPAGAGDSAGTWVTVEGLSDKLCGRSRPGHFRGVATAVAKLLNIVEPTTAYFGQKDAAQVAVVRQMVRDLHFDVEIAVCPIVRDADGLALSSRNGYLSAAERKQALALYRALCRLHTLADQGRHNSQELIQTAKDILAEQPAVRVDYVEIVDPNTLEPTENISAGALVAVAAFVGKTRLIDNILLYGAGARR